MNIAFDCERMKYPHTGLFEYCYQLGLALKQEKTIDDKIKYYLRENDQHYFDAKNDFLIRKPIHKLFFPNYKNVDLWHISHQTSVYVPRSPKIKKLLTIHDLNFLYEGKSNRKEKSYLKQHQNNIDRADQIVTISNYTKADVLKYLNTHGKPISVIYNGCTKIPLNLGIEPIYQPGKPFLFALGTINAKKNFHVLLPLLNNNDFELIIAGRIDPSYLLKIKEEAVKYNVVQRVKVIGPINDQDKSWYYKNCEAFLFPSLAEGFGIPPIEAMSFGKPVFLSEATSLPEIGGTLAYYFNSYDPEEMRTVFLKGMNHYNESKPAQAIIEHARQFSWKNSAIAYWNLYRNFK